jgi:hypothetical protein
MFNSKAFKKFFKRKYPYSPVAILGTKERARRKIRKKRNVIALAKLISGLVRVCRLAFYLDVKIVYPYVQFIRL